MNNLQSALIHGALSDPVRRLIVDALLGGEKTVGALAKLANIAQPGVTRHLNRLVRAGLIERSTSGRKTLCRLNAVQYRAFWLHNLNALDAHLTQETVVAAIPTIELRHEIQAPIERVFAAWTDAEQIKQWFVPEGFTTPAVKMDARPGGAYRIEMKSPEGEDFIVRGEIDTIEENAEIRMTWCWEEEDSADEHTSTVTVLFSTQGAHTTIALTHSQLASEASVEKHTHGWDRCMASLIEWIG